MNLDERIRRGGDELHRQWHYEPETCSICRERAHRVVNAAVPDLDPLDRLHTEIAALYDRHRQPSDAEFEERGKRIIAALDAVRAAREGTP